MKVAVIGSNGKTGRLIVEEALSRGLDVVGIARSKNNSKTEKFIQKDIFDLTTEDLNEFDAVVDAFGTWTPETLHQHNTTLQHLCDILSGSKVRLLVVGGAGSLYIDSTHTTQLQDGVDFPDAYKPVAKNMGIALENLRKRNDVQWTYLSPAADFQVDGMKTDEYILSGEEFTVNSNNESIISYADYVSALVDEIISGNHIQKRISVLQK